MREAPPRLCRSIAVAVSAAFSLTSATPVELVAASGARTFSGRAGGMPRSGSGRSTAAIGVTMRRPLTPRFESLVAILLPVPSEGGRERGDVRGEWAIDELPAVEP